MCHRTISKRVWMLFDDFAYQESHDQLDDSICEPHDDNSDNHVENDVFGFLDFLFITSSDEDLESCIDNIDDGNDRDESEKIDNSILCIYWDWFLGNSQDESPYHSDSITETIFGITADRGLHFALTPVESSSTGRIDLVAPCQEVQYQ